MARGKRELDPGEGSPEPRADGVGELLRAARQRLGLTLRELAEDRSIGVSATFLSRVERNEALPSDELMVKLAKRLGVDASTALLQLFRERASPEVRELVPSPSVIKLSETSRPPSDFAGGLERMAEPVSQILDLHRELIAENARLRDEMQRMRAEMQTLSAEVVDTKRQFLPDVNRFLTSLFGYDIDLTRREVTVSRSGDASITTTVEGIVPKRGGKPIRTLSHTAFLPQAADGSLNIAGHSASLTILEKPDDLEVEHTFKRESPERGTFMVNFPEGFSWAPDRGRLSYQFSYRLEKAFAMTFEEAKAVYGRRTVHDTPLEWSTCYINKPSRRLDISVTFPEGYSPTYVDRFVWFTETSFLENDYNLADRLLLDPEDGIEIEEGERTVVRLRARSPILGFSYGIVWKPLPKRQFLRLIRS